MSELEDLRIEAGLSLPELSKQAGVSRDTVTKAERGEAIRAFVAGKICQVLSKKLGRRITYKDAQINIL